jgi:O-antigen ligase
MKLKTLQRVALCILFFSINFEVWDPLNTDGSFSISSATGYFYLVTVIYQLPAFLKMSSLKSYLWPLITFFLFLSVMNFLNMNSVSSVFINLSILQNIILLIILINHERRDPGVLQKGMVWFAVGSIVLAIFFQLGIGVSYDSARVTVFGDNQNSIGVKESISVLVLLLLVFKNNLRLGRWRFFILLSIPIMLLLMAQTGSRTAFFSFSLMFVSSLFLVKAKHSYYKLFTFMFGLIIGYFIWQYLASSEILYSRLILTEQKLDLGGRDRVWDNVIPFVKENIIFGKGESGYTEYMTNITGAFYSPHNVILEVLAYTGILGLFLYLLFLYKVFVISQRKYKEDGSIIQLLLLIPILGLLLSGQLLNVKIGYIVFAFCLSGIFSLRRRKRRNRKEEIEIYSTIKLESV